MKRVFKISGIIVGIVSLILIAIVVAYGFVVFMIFQGGILLLPNPPKPEITYGEFPFRLVYEIEGKTEVLEDSIVCEFDGFEVKGENGKYRKWKMYIKSTGKDMITLYDLRSNDDFTEWGNQVLELCFAPGNSEYYMGDVGSMSREGSMGKWIDYLYLTPNGEEGYSAFELDEAWEKYRIRIISWEPSPPIENTFK